MKAQPDEFIPVAYFGFSMIGNEKVIHQLWVTPLGKEEWRPVPMLELGQQRKPAVAGFIPADDGPDDDD